MDRDVLDINEHIEDEESSLRPASFDEYVGQHDLKENLRVFVGAAKMRDETLDHVLFYGPPNGRSCRFAYIFRTRRCSLY